MKRSTFIRKNIWDKLTKGLRAPSTLGFYLDTYLLAKLNPVDPDICLVSYPKCGRTWISYMLHRYLEHAAIEAKDFRDKSLFALSQTTVLKLVHDQGNWVPAPPRLDRLEFNREKYADKRIVFLVRDPRDVLVSSWYHLKYRERIYNGDLSAFVREKLVGIEKIVAFMNLWLAHRNHVSGFLLVMYEQLHENAVGQLTTLLEFTGIDVDPEAVKRSAEDAVFEKMQKEEKNHTNASPWLRPGSENRSESMKVRQGKVGGYKTELTADDREYVDQIIRNTLAEELSVYY